MNRINIASLIMIAFMAVSVAFAGEAKEVKMKTNLHCGSCKSKIEKGLKTHNGIESMNVDVASKMVTVRYNPDLTNEASLTKAISGIGYKAEVVDAEAKSCSTKKSCSTSARSTSAKKDCDPSDCSTEGKVKTSEAEETSTVKTSMK